MKVILQLFAIAFVVVIASSCRDEFTEKDAIDLQSQAAADAAQLDASLSLEQQREMELLRDSLARIGGIIHYTVSVVDAGNAIFVDGEGNNYRTTGMKSVSGAVVTVSQNGVIASQTTGADGLVVFNDMRVGNVAVNVAVTDFTDVNYVADITPKGVGTGASSDVNNSEITRNAATQIPVFPTTGPNTSTVSGRVTLETDLTNSAFEFPASVNVIATINPDEEFVKKFVFTAGQSNADPYYGNENFAGRILRMSYADASVSGPVDPATGTYSLTVPASAAGLEMFVVTSDVIADQTLYWETTGADGQPTIAPATARTLFGPGVSDGDWYYNEYPYEDNGGDLGSWGDPSTIPDPDAAYVTFSAPTGATGDGFGKGATAEARIGMAGTVESIRVTESGKMYSQVPDVRIIGAGTGAAATAVLGAENSVVSVTVDNAGSGYEAGTYVADDGGTVGDPLDDTILPRTSVSVEFGGEDAVLEATLLASIATENDNGDPVVFNMNILGNPLGLGNDFAAIPAPTFVNSDAGAGTGATAIAYGSVSNNSIISAPGSGYVSKYFINDGGGTDRISGPELIVSAPDFPVADDATHYEQAEGYADVQGPVTAIALDVEGAQNNIAGTDRKYMMDDRTAPTLPIITVSPAKGATATVAMSTSDGRLAQTVVTNGGAGFTFTPNVTMTNGTGVTQSAILQVSNMGVDAISVTTAGTGYLRNPDNGSALASITGGGGAGATGTITLGTSATGVYWTGLALPQPGYTASTNATWTFDGGGPNPADQIVVTGTVDAGGNLVSLAVTQAGAGFTSNVNPNFVSATNNVGGDEAFVQVTFSVASVTVTAGGSGYSSSPTATFPTPSGGNPLKVTAAGAATLEVLALSIIEDGAGYNYSDVANVITISGGGGAGATALPFFATSIASVTVGTGGNYLSTDAFDLTITHTAPVTLPPSLTTFGSNPLVYNDPGGLDDDSQVWITGGVFNIAFYVPTGGTTAGGLGYSGTGLTVTVDNTDGGTAAAISPLVSDAGAFAWINAGGAGYVVNSTPTFEVDVEYNGESEPITSFTFPSTTSQWVDALLSLAVIDGGSGYTAAPWVRIQEVAVSGDEDPIYRYEDVSTTVSGGAVTGTSIDVVRTYDSYPDISVVIFKEAASAEADITTSGVIAFEVTDGGQDYAVVPDVIVIEPTSGGSGAAGTAVIQDGRVVSITIDDAGSGYTSAPSVYLKIPNTPYNAIGEVTVNLKGVVTAVSVTCSGCNVGWGYTAPPTVTITSADPAIGSGATAVATINSSGEVASVIVTNGGSGYVAENDTEERAFSVWPDGPWFISYPAKARAKDIDLGTGMRDDDRVYWEDD